MQKHEYVKRGETKAVNIDFTFMFPSTAYFVNVNMLIEFTLLGQVIPTRFDVNPYRLSTFNKQFDNESTRVIDFFKFLLVLYTIWAVLTDLAKYKSCS